MNEQTIAAIAVKATNIIKISENLTPQDLITVLLEKIPELAIDADFAIIVFTNVADKLGIAYKDVYDIIGQLQYRVKTAITDVLRSSWLQDIAGTLYYALKALSGLLPEPWYKISMVIVGAYEALYGGEGK